MSALIEFQGFNKFFGEQQVLNGIDLRVQSGEVLVILGPSGCGKSTLLQYLADPALVEPYCEAAGRVLCRGRIAYLPQNPEFPEKTDILFQCHLKFTTAQFMFCKIA